MKALPFQSKTFSKSDTKSYWTCPVLYDIFNFFKIFWPWLSDNSLLKTYTTLFKTKVCCYFTNLKVFFKTLKQFIEKQFCQKFKCSVTVIWHNRRNWSHAERYKNEFFLDIPGKKYWNITMWCHKPNFPQAKEQIIST